MSFLQNVWVCVSECLWERESVWRKNDYSPGTFSLNALLCIFFKIVLENYRWNNYDWEIHLFLFWWRVARPGLCSVRLIVHLVKSRQCGIHFYFWVQKCLLFFRDSLWSVNTESQLAINVLYTPYFFMLLRRDVCFKWCSDIRVDILNCLFLVSHYISDALDVCLFFVCFFLDLFFFRSILDGSQYLEKMNTHFYVWETSSF